MAIRMAPVLECDICAHRWLQAKQDGLPVRCAGPEHHRKWNKEGIDETVPVPKKKRKRDA